MTGRLLVLDDHASFADALGSLLSRAGHTIVAALSDEGHARAVIETAAIDAALLDIELPAHTAGGVRVGSHLRSLQPAAKLMFLSAHVTPGDVSLQQALDLCPEGVIGKNEPAQQIIDVVGHVLSGGRYYSPELPNAGTKTHGLTAAERLVLAELSRSPDNRARLASRLGISASTLDTHLLRIKAKVLVAMRTDDQAPDDGVVSTERLIGWARDRGYHIL